MKIFKDWNLFEKIWLGTFVLINIIIAVISKDSLLGFTASVTGIICVVLVAKGKVSNYFFGVINVLLYGYLSLSAKYYGEAMLNLIYFLPMQFIGLWIWLKNKTTIDEVSEVKAEKMTLKELADKLSVDKSYISKVENGVINPSVGFFYRIMNALGLNVEITKTIG